MDITIYNADRKTAEAAIEQVEQTFQIMHHEWHAWEKGGIVSKINQAIANQQAITIPQSVADFIVKSQRLSQQSMGLFDPGIGSLVELWGFHSEKWQGPPPSDEAIRAWLSHKPSIANLSIQGNQLISSNRYVQLDFGGNAKGLAIDIALQTLQDDGIKNALVSIGGDMKAMGSKDHQAWSIGIQNPQNPNQAIAQIALSGGESIVTSGNYQRYFEWQGKRYSHILDPNTGYPANTFSSVTVIHADATTADSAATAILVAGPEHWLEVAKSMGITQAFCVDNQGKILQTKEMAKRVKLL
ncbi:FAD:protein FMN transferase [Thiomicrorhabdus immobilis]|uniref:FAD:protein FMN transferase n=1 Tax=Thiomicrorhabdus immobilis TaxID=2791037 RepID=A0ABM7MFA3_9GAMM|nr:FAD:protein FMN transferase [Thiomicrorhabdus immobilis]BCN94109.1 FAD:protein FMN transferase [Thiomicrorhabdus immobilis]